MAGKYKAISVWAQERDSQIIESLKKGVSLYELAQYWKLSEGTIRVILKRYGIVVKRSHL